MICKKLLCIIAIIFLSACGETITPEHYIPEIPIEEELTETYYKAEEKIEEKAEIISLSEFKSEFNSFGNNLNGNTVAYDSFSECYYLSQPFYYEQYIYGSSNILACLSTLSSDFSSYNLLTETGVENIVVSDGRIFYREYCNGEGYNHYSISHKVTSRPSAKTLIRLKENDILYYYVDNDAIYYACSENNGKNTYFYDRYHKVFEEKLDMPDSEPQVIIDSCKFFQVIGENMFYLGYKGIYQLNLNTKECKFVFDRKDIGSFIIDGFLVYKDTSGNLYFSEESNYIDRSVITYNIYGDYIIYSTFKGLFVYNTLDMSTECILSKEDDSNFRNVLAINICNGQIFLSMQTSESNKLQIDNTYLFILDFENGHLQSVNDYYPDYHSFRYVYFSTEEHYRAYEVSYPVGFMLYNDVGSSFGRITTMWSPDHSVIIYAGAVGGVGDAMVALPETDAERIPLTTYKGEKGNYVCFEEEDMLYFVFSYNKSCSLIAHASAKERDYIMPILLEMSKTLHEYIYCAEINSQ